MTLSTQRIRYQLLAIVLILMIPFVALQFSDEVNWTVRDFIIGGALLLGLALAGELIMATITKTSHRLLLGGAALLVFLLVWAELAVGVFGSPFAGS